MIKVILVLPNLKKIILELDDKIAPKTVSSFLDSLPLRGGMNFGEGSFTQIKLL
jgi:cyclophilin family peptidyl-prolyl cis-trans isomerase